MCLGIPAKIIQIKDPVLGIASAETDGVKRDINLAMLASQFPTLDTLVGKWVLLHVGFAMAVIDQQQAQETLSLLKEAGHAE